MTYQQFQKDLNEKGKPIERNVLGLVKNLYDKDAYHVEGYCKEFDIICPNRRTRMEVKNCSAAKWFVPIEFSVQGKPSGLATSKSEYWVIFSKNRYFFIEAEILRKLVKDKEMQKYRIDDQDVELKLLKLEDLEEFSSRVI